MNRERNNSNGSGNQCKKLQYKIRGSAQKQEIFSNGNLERERDQEETSQLFTRNTQMIKAVTSRFWQ